MKYAINCSSVYYLEGGINILVYFKYFDYYQNRGKMRSSCYMEIVVFYVRQDVVIWISVVIITIKENDKFQHLETGGTH